MQTLLTLELRMTISQPIWMIGLFKDSFGALKWTEFCMHSNIDILRPVTFGTGVQMSELAFYFF